jgi:hypothetical protein
MLIFGTKKAIRQPHLVKERDEELSHGTSHHLIEVTIAIYISLQLCGLPPTNQVQD